MQVILLSDMRHMGRRGEVVQAKDGYARNFLIPEGLAVHATQGNLNWFEHQRKKVEAKNLEEQQEAALLAARIDGTSITLLKRAGETETLYGSVTAADVSEALAAKGFEVDRRQVDLSGGIKTLGEHQIRLIFHPEVSAGVTITVEAEE